MDDIRLLEPKQLWNYFYELTRIPRPSKKEARVIAYVEKFGKDLGLETIVDEVGNVIIRKPATKGYENRKGVVLQGHLDMVPQKNSDKVHDFEKDPIEAYVDGEWVTANGTTLGADNGIGVAAAMAILASTDMQHGPIEALFTIDEETGMTGAFGLKPGLLMGDILINMDSEDDGEIFVGCAGGVNVNISKKYSEVSTPSNTVAYKIIAKGMKGGHSGVDIALGRANSNKIMIRFLYQAEKELGARISSMAGGDMRNAIPREANGVVVVDSSKTTSFEQLVAKYEKIYREEFSETEPGLIFTCEQCDKPQKVMEMSDQSAIVRSLFACPNGIQRMSQAMIGLVETSNNLAIVRISNGQFEAKNLTRSSVDSAKDATVNKISAVFELAGASVEESGSYPGWNPDMNSPILQTMKTIYKRLFGIEPKVSAIHAGLECGLLGGVYPNLDMISVGPTLRYPHSPDEKVNIETVKRFYKFVVETLKEVPVK
jgi:dipeptidase D